MLKSRWKFAATTSVRFPLFGFSVFRPPRSCAFVNFIPRRASSELRSTMDPNGLEEALDLSRDRSQYQVGLGSLSNYWKTRLMCY